MKVKAFGSMHTAVSLADSSHLVTFVTPEPQDISSALDLQLQFNKISTISIADFAYKHKNWPIPPFQPPLLQTIQLHNHPEGPKRLYSHSAWSINLRTTVNKILKDMFHPGPIQVQYNPQK